MSITPILNKKPFLMMKQQTQGGPGDTSFAFCPTGESQWQLFGDEVGSDSELTELGRRQTDHLGR